MKSSTKVWVFLVFACLSIIILGEHLGGRWGLLVGFLIATVFLLLILLSVQKTNLKKMHAIEVLGQDSYNLNERVKKWSDFLLIKKPKVYLLPFATATAFSTGSPWGTSSLALSQGLLKKLSPEELDAIIAHQICHIARMDTFAFAVASAISDSILYLADFLDQFWLPNRFKKNLQWQNQKPFQFILTPIAWLLIRLKVRETTYYENDDLAAKILPDRKVLAKALWKLESLNQARPLNIPACSSHLFVVNPTGLKEKHWFYNTHPKVNVRIRRLVGYEPL